LQTPPQDLKSILGIKLKRTLLLALVKKDFLPNNLEKRDQLLEKHKKHILPEDEAEWYGLTLSEAAEKLANIKAAENHVEKKPLKLEFREEFIAQLKEKGIPEPGPISRSPSSILGRLSSLNPFQSNKSM
jgi:large subunit ribosomal protein L28